MARRRRGMVFLLGGNAPVVTPRRAGCQDRSWFRLGLVSDEPARFLTPASIRFCPLCGGTLGPAAVPPDQREQAVCAACGSVFYLNPNVLPGTIPAQDVRVLLTRPSIYPGRGLCPFAGRFLGFSE